MTPSYTIKPPNRTTRTHENTLVSPPFSLLTSSRWCTSSPAHCWSNVGKKREPEHQKCVMLEYKVRVVAVKVLTSSPLSHALHHVSHCAWILSHYNSNSDVNNMHAMMRVRKQPLRAPQGKEKKERRRKGHQLLDRHRPILVRQRLTTD